MYLTIIISCMETVCDQLVNRIIIEMTQGEIRLMVYWLVVKLKKLCISPGKYTCTRTVMGIALPFPVFPSKLNTQCIHGTHIYLYEINQKTVSKSLNVGLTITCWGKKKKKVVQRTQRGIYNISISGIKSRNRPMRYTWQPYIM